MAFTQQQLDDLDAAIASGTLTVRYSTPQGDRSITYDSLDALLRRRAIVAAALGQGPSGPNRILSQHSAGYRRSVGSEEYFDCP